MVFSVYPHHIGLGWQLQGQIKVIGCSFNFIGLCIIEHVLLDTLVNIMNDVTLQTIPKVNINSKLKPYWNPMLTELNKFQLRLRQRWIQCGKPRDEHSDCWKEYKSAKSSYHKSVKAAEYEYVRCVEELTRNEQIDQRYFWYLVNRSRKPSRTKRMQPTRDHQDRLLYDPQSITESWRHYYADLHTPKSEPWYDNEHYEQVRETLASLRDHYLNKECHVRIFTEEDIRHKCTKLKCRKAAGVDGITGENLKYGGPVLHTCLSILFNSITTHKVIPDQLKRAVIIPIPKGKNKDLTNKDNYRGISLLPVINK